MSILLDAQSRVLVQGITGRQARTHVRYMVEYGTRVVAGVAPGKGGSRVEGIPVFDTVRSALRFHPADIAVLFVPGRAAREAALEAIAHQVPLVVILAEGVPHHDTAEILWQARGKGVRVIGPNSQGMISPGKAKLGGTGGEFPDRMYRPGPVGIISRSGGMGGEIASALTRRGIGQSTYVSIGGDLLIGTGFADLLPLFEADPETAVVVLFGEPGTGHEEAAADLIAHQKVSKPVVAFVCGESLERLPQGMSFGHTSHLIARGEGSPTRKKQVLREAGALVADRFEEIPDLVIQALQGRQATERREEV
ncbi:MAG: succinate--CoA ligase subunit alpha [Nitrospinota bacterium]|nr:MAG: succinate--CoA ligase subunit alpha [Nitrospinota bacterium]